MMLVAKQQLGETEGRSYGEGSIGHGGVRSW